MTKASFRTLLGGVAAGAAWIGLWFAAPEMAARAGGLFDDVRIAGAVDFFIADTAKIFLLLFLMVYLLACRSSVSGMCSCASDGFPAM